MPCRCGALRKDGQQWHDVWEVEGQRVWVASAGGGGRGGCAGGSGAASGARDADRQLGGSTEAVCGKSSIFCCVGDVCPVSLGLFEQATEATDKSADGRLFYSGGRIAHQVQRES